MMMTPSASNGVRPNIMEHIPNNPNSKLLKTCTINIRSIRNKSEAIKELFLKLQLDILTITETWLNGLSNQETDLTVIQSPPYPSAGIMILLSKEFKNIQQVLPAAWTRNTIAIAAQLHNKTIYIVGHYTQPD